MVTDEKATEKPETPAPSGGERSPLFSMTGWIVVIGICIVEGVIFTVVANLSKKPAGTGEVGEVTVAYWQLDPAFQVTISQDGLFHGFETKISLGMARHVWEEEKEKKKLTDRGAKVRDTILTVLQSQKWPDVMQVPGQERLRKEILAKMQEVLGQEVVTEVCFESFSPR